MKLPNNFKRLIMLSKQTITFTNEEWDAIYHSCHKFANLEIQTTEKQRNRRNQWNRDKMIVDNRIGKIGEWAVAFNMWKNEIECNEPDMEIYTVKKKSFDADLVYKDGVDLHVKSQSVVSAQRYGASWTFQKGGQGYGHTDPILRSGDGMAIFAIVDEKNHKADIFGPMDLDTLRNNLRDPKLQKLKHTKACLYLSDFTITENGPWVQCNCDRGRSIIYGQQRPASL